MNQDDYRELREAAEPVVIGELDKYLRRLIIEEPYIRARLENPGGSVVLMPSSNPDQISYNPNIGNDTHLDLILAEEILSEDFSKGEQDTIREWALGHTSAQAAEYNLVKPSTIRKRRERVLNKLERKLNERGFESGRSGDGIPQGSSEEGQDITEETGHTGRSETEARE